MTPLEEEENSIQSEILKLQARLATVALLTPMLRDVPWESNQCWIGTWNKQMQIHLCGDNHEANQKTTHALIQAFGGKFDKIVAANSFTLKGDWNGMTVIITNYIPPSCHIEYEYVEIPEQIIAAHTEIKAKIVCKELQ